MVLTGTLVNVVSILLGSLIGWKFRNIPMRVRETVLQGIALCVVIMGLSMTLHNAVGPGRDYDLILVIVSLVIGGVIGEWLDIEALLNRVGRRLERAFPQVGNEGRTAQAFMTASLVFCVGAMAILGGLESGLQGRHGILMTKSLLDGISSVLFASALGPGVALSAIPVLLYQGSIALAAGWVQHWMTPPITAAVTATGGVLILGIGLNLLELTTVRIGNLLPALLVAAGLRGALSSVLGW